MRYPGPDILPFEHDDVRVYIDNLFVDGILKPVSCDASERFWGTWMQSGVQSDPDADRARRMNALLDKLDTGIPGDDAKYRDWIYFAQSLAELQAAQYSADDSTMSRKDKHWSTIQQRMDTAFAAWLEHRYASLVNLPPSPPVMLHHVPRFLARLAEGGDERRKIALIVIDGLAMDQWVAIRETLSDQQERYAFHEEGIFAWVPTLTSVSRQSLFAGRPPLFFPDSINSTYKEPMLWTHFWVDHGFSDSEIIYAKSVDEQAMDSVLEKIEHPKARIVGLVVDKIDKIMHGMELGTAGMHNQARQWAGQPFLPRLFDALLEKDFDIYVTSDHGNIQATGCGRPSEGATADLRGERVRIYSDAMLRDQVEQDFPEAIVWPTHGLPEDYLPLIAPDRAAFVTEGKQTVAHGGTCIEEIIVPFVRVERGSI